MKRDGGVGSTSVYTDAFEMLSEECGGCGGRTDRWTLKSGKRITFERCASCAWQAYLEETERKKNGNGIADGSGFQSQALGARGASLTK